MKTYLRRVGLVGLVGLSLAVSGLGAAAETNQLYTKTAEGAFVPVALSTNETTSFLSGPLVDLLGTMSRATNWGVATFGIYMPSTTKTVCRGNYCQAGDKAHAGAGALFLYNINSYVATGVGIDWLDNQTTMPSGQIQFQAPLRLGGEKGVTVTPFAFTGIATPVSGMGEDNGSVVGLFGAGLSVKIWGGLQGFYAIEKRTGQPEMWNLFGLAYSKAF